MEAIQRFTSRCVPLLRDHVDTDQIFPGRYLTTVDKAGAGDRLFANWRYDPDGRSQANFILNRPEMRDRRILVSGENFGAGSSREHAVWALLDFGFRAIAARSFADIFCSNAMKNGLLPIKLSSDAHSELVAALRIDQDAEVTVDLLTTTLTLPGGRLVTFPIEPFTKSLLLEGTDELGYLLGHRQAIEAFEDRHPADVDTRVIPNPTTGAGR